MKLHALPEKKRIITRPVWVLSLVSLFTDIASEMLYPVMPLFLDSIGFSIIMIGLLEGLAEATAGLSKGYFGQWSDRVGRRVPFIRAGYTMSALSKPMMAVFAFPLWVFASRTLDRLGKGVRTGARDAFLSAQTSPENKGRVFGFHRALDTLGAFAGPCLALLFLHLYPGEYYWLFVLAIVPGIISIGLTFLIREPDADHRNIKKRPGFFEFFRYLKDSQKNYRRLIAGLLAFTLINSSDIFLLLMIKHAGLEDSSLILLYIFYNFIYALFAYPAGIIGDRFGLRKTFIAGLFLFSAVYLGMAAADSWLWFGVLFFLYGIYAACTESIAKAWITNHCRDNETGTAIGTYTALNSLSGMIASTLAGILWLAVSPAATFLFSGIAAILVACYFIFMVREGTKKII